MNRDEKFAQIERDHAETRNMLASRRVICKVSGVRGVVHTDTGDHEAACVGLTIAGPLITFELETGVLAGRVHAHASTLYLGKVGVRLPLDDFAVDGTITVVQPVEILDVKPPR